MSFALYLIGFAIFLGGVAWLLITLGVPNSMWLSRVLY